MQKKGLGHRVISAMDVNPLLPHFSKVLKKHHKSMLFNKLYLQEVLYSPPLWLLSDSLQTYEASSVDHLYIK